VVRLPGPGACRERPADPAELTDSQSLSLVVSRKPAVGGVTDLGGSGAMDSVGPECRSAGVTECGSAGLMFRLPGPAAWSGCLVRLPGPGACRERPADPAELTDSQSLSLVVSRKPADGGVTDLGGSGAMDSVGPE
jgi:hypothetical protein